MLGTTGEISYGGPPNLPLYITVNLESVSSWVRGGGGSAGFVPTPPPINPAPFILLGTKNCNHARVSAVGLRLSYAVQHHRQLQSRKKIQTMSNPKHFLSVVRQAAYTMRLARLS